MCLCTCKAAVEVSGYLHEVFTLADIDLLDCWVFIWLADRMLFGSLCSLSEQRTRKFCFTNVKVCK